MFQGVFTALVTPFKDGRVDDSALGDLIEFQISQGVDGVVPCGTTGESATLSHAEHRHVIDFCVQKVDGRVQVIAGTGSNATTETIELTRFAKDVGASGALLITPYYNKPTQEGLFRHFEAVANAVEMPLILYNVPGRTSLDMKPETVVRLSHVPHIVAIKEATADMERASVLLQQIHGSMVLLSGDDATFLPFLAVGGQGIISVTANIAPAQMVALWRHWQQGDVGAARQVHAQLLDVARLLFCETNPIPVKAAVAMMGMCGPELRLPLTSLSESYHEPLRQAMQCLGLFPDAVRQCMTHLSAIPANSGA